jgi:Zinc knuckle
LKKKRVIRVSRLYLPNSLRENVHYVERLVTRRLIVGNLRPISLKLEGYTQGEKKKLGYKNSNIISYNCNEKGHIVRDCPKRAYKKLE